MAKTLKFSNLQQNKLVKTPQCEISLMELTLMGYTIKTLHLKLHNLSDLSAQI